MASPEGYWSCGRWCPSARGWSWGRQLTYTSRNPSWRRWSWRGRCGRWRTLVVGSLPPSGPLVSAQAPGKKSRSNDTIIDVSLSTRLRSFVLCDKVIFITSFENNYTVQENGALEDQTCISTYCLCCCFYIFTFASTLDCIVSDSLTFLYGS